MASSSISASIFPTGSLTELYGKPIDKIGRGGFGDVFVTNKGYAVKIIKNEDQYIYPPDLHGMVFPACLDHPNIIKYHNIYIGTKDISLVMKLYEIDVWHHMFKYPSIYKNIKTFKSLCAQMVSAVAYLTSRKILHGDIKPPNILIQRCSDFPLRFNFILADFDLAQDRICQRINLGYNELYTPDYRPPELLIGYQEAQASADVWALGVTLLGIFTQQNFFGHDKLSELLDKINLHVPLVSTQFGSVWKHSTIDEDKPDFPEFKPFVDNPEVETFLHKMIQLDPDLRVSIFDLQNDEFLKEERSIPIPSSRCIIPSTPVKTTSCAEGIDYFDRQIDFRPLLERENLGVNWKRLTQWMLDLGSLHYLSADIMIMSYELIGRYLLINTTFEKTKLQALGCVGIYVSASFNNKLIPPQKLAKMTSGAVTTQQILEMSAELLTLLNFDLCAKTGYDYIIQTAGNNRRSGTMAAEYLQIAYTKLESFVDPESPEICLDLMLEYYGDEKSFSSEKMEVWRKQFENTIDTYEGKSVDLDKIQLFLNHWR